MPTRRQFLEYAGTAGAGLVLSASAIDTVACRRSSSGGGPRREVSVGGQRVRTIDVHTHCFIADVWPLVKDYPWADRRILAAIDQKRPERVGFDIVGANRIAHMNRVGTDTQVLSINPFWYTADEKLSRAICDVQNKGLDAVCKAYPGRFLAYAAIALQHPEMAAEQLEGAVKQYGFVGASIPCNVAGEELSSPRFDPFWKKIQDLGVVAFMHPGNDGGFDGERYPKGMNDRLGGKGMLFNVIGHPLETSIALGHLIYEGTFDRFPGLKIIGAHGGGFIASYTERFDASCSWNDEACRPGQKKASEYFRSQIFCDTKVFTTEGLRHLVAEHTAPQILFGTDHPAPWPVGGVDQILDTPGLSDADKIGILGGTFARMLKLPTTV